MSPAKLGNDNWRRIGAFAENRVYRVLTGNAFPGNRTIDEHARSVMARFQDLPSIKERVSADLGAARRLIDHLEKRAPGTKASLEFSGAGNDPRLIRLAIKEARRRGL